jgi:tetratricopeptide (TPR) repeat protein
VVHCFVEEAYMVRLAQGIMAFGIVVGISTSAFAQAPGGGQPPPPMTNLQIFPKDTPRPQVVQAMQGFTQALGVRCDYCHAEQQQGRPQDFASDDKRTKKVAREMMRLTEDVNARVPAAVAKTAADATRVQCVTCHRGVAIPKQLTDILAETAAANGLPAALARYRELRQQYYGSQSYDFSENAALTLAQRANQAGRADEAIAWAQLDLEFYPRSARGYVSLGTAYNAKKDTPSAIASLEKALEIDPQNAQAQRMLEQLRKQDR